MYATVNGSQGIGTLDSPLYLQEERASHPFSQAKAWSNKYPECILRSSQLACPKEGDRSTPDLVRRLSDVFAQAGQCRVRS